MAAAEETSRMCGRKECSSDAAVKLKVIACPEKSTNIGGAVKFFYEQEECEIGEETSPVY